MKNQYFKKIKKIFFSLENKEIINNCFYKEFLILYLQLYNIIHKINLILKFNKKFYLNNYNSFIEK